MMTALPKLTPEDRLTGSAGPAQPAAAPDCVAFVSDNQTHGAITAVCGLRFPNLRVRDGGSREALEYLAEGGRPKLLIVDVSDSHSPLTALLPIIAAFAEQTKLIAIGTANDISLYREMIEAGVAEYLVKPVPEKSLHLALGRLDERPAEAAKPGVPERRPVVALVGTRGGVGTSTLAINCAWLIAHEFKRRAALLDLDLQYGTVALALDVEPTHGLREALEHPSRIDSLFISSATVKIGEKLVVMAAEEAAETDFHYDASAVDLLLDELARQADCVVVDVPRSYPAARARVLANATEVVAVTDLSLAGLRDAIRLQGQVQMLAPLARLVFVANHVSGHDGGVPRQEFERALGRKLDFAVPADPKAAANAANSGKPIAAVAPGSKMLQPLKAIVSGLCESGAAEEGRPKRRLWPLRRK